MGRMLVFTGPRQAGFEEYEEPALRPDEVRLRTLYSGISAGTELTAYRGTNPYLHKRWEPGPRLFVPAEKTSLEYPVRGWGYEEVGEVIEAGSAVADVPLGARVFGAWGHRSHHVVPADYARSRLLPPGLEPILGIFSQIGAIALNGVHDGRIRLGETVAVFGLGGLGQIVAQAARHSGAQVIAVDLHDARLEMAAQLGVHATINAGREKAAEVIKEVTGGRGADVCFEVSGYTAALNEAIRAAAYSARVVAMGFFQGEAQGLYLGEEFHHNRINVVGSQIFGPDPELKYRWDQLRLAQTAIRLQAEGVLNLRPLITHVEPFDNGPALFATLDRTPEQVVQAVIEFPAG
ncbi:MAG: zinc-binding alcohol dehydrogenase [Chloroflexi bacterium]|nr:zinc-binding alcohol dehydrogenase [Chloroflexota bacterium]MCI0574944.1 zinc-binding alcohol dehydrogenase [Chloroflexota bacterium]MCI0645854.1 zinc-binding alcohol dehydrogenase [Chloroflexota bacterium]MCI0725709.1 zinc-binding alcohol dehydrogenase [Chloroflexota bacterium]